MFEFLSVPIHAKEGRIFKNDLTYISLLSRIKTALDIIIIKQYTRKFLILKLKIGIRNRMPCIVIYRGRVGNSKVSAVIASGNKEW